MMRRFFQPKYLVYVLAFLALAIAISDVSAPKIEEYNRLVREKQEWAHFEASGRYKRSFFNPSDCRARTYEITVFSLILFLSLIFSKRIGFSFLLITLFIVQFVAAQFMGLSLRKSGYHVSYPESVFFNWLLMAFILTSSFWLALGVVKRKNHAK